jgi:hypothetical protein
MTSTHRTAPELSTMVIVIGNTTGPQVFTDAPLELNITPPMIVAFASCTDWMVNPW